jgi:hypothetical protein
MRKFVRSLPTPAGAAAAAVVEDPGTMMRTACTKEHLPPRRQCPFVRKCKQCSNGRRWSTQRPLSIPGARVINTCSDRTSSAFSRRRTRSVWPGGRRSYGTRSIEEKSRHRCGSYLVARLVSA